ncbi:pesticin C-terminus-like muramidase [Marilutibacter alkalisoli]|nr:pesticin C-terminus-like muramidase [Lysobacter alkalisoli]
MMKDLQSIGVSRPVSGSRQGTIHSSKGWNNWITGLALVVLFVLSPPSAWAEPCPDPGMCFFNQNAKDAWANDLDCDFGDDGEGPAGDDCTETWRLDDAFLEQSEGALILEGYIPMQGGEVLGQSGVTISTGVDLGQQSASGTRNIINNYINEHGNNENVDVDAFMAKLNPYFGLKKGAAVAALEETPLTVTQAEAELLAEAFKHHFLNQIAAQFNARNELGMTFQRLPTEAQTVIMDFAYQYGLSDTQGSVRQTFWGHVYRGEWMQLAEWLNSNPDPYTSRRRREGNLLQDAIDNHRIPNVGDPCPGG